MTRREETKLVKDALEANGYRGCRVKHGTGTAHGWLKIYLSAGTSWDVCTAAMMIAMQVTGRSGEYNGRINVMSQ